MLRCAVFETTLDEKVTETVDHEWMTVSDDSVDDFVFLGLRCDFELLLQEERRLLITLTNDFFND